MALSTSSRVAPKTSTRRRSPQSIRLTEACLLGQIFHAAGPSGGWTIVAVHDSQASWETFRD